MKRIICVGNRYIFQDSAGPAVYERLLQYTLPGDIEVIDGGLAGLDLLRFVEGSERVIFVDGVAAGEQNTNCQLVVLEAAEVAAVASKRYEHSAGLPYLLRVLPQVCQGTVPHILLVGIEGYPDEKIIDQAAILALQLVVGDDSGLTGGKE